MKPWAIGIAIVAGLGIVALLIFDSDERGFAERANAGASSQPGMQLAALAAIERPEDAIADIIGTGRLSDELEVRLEEARQQIADAREQSGDAAQDVARAQLERASDTLDDVLERVDEAADDTDNLARQARLERVHDALTSIQDRIEAWLDQL